MLERVKQKIIDSGILTTCGAKFLTLLNFTRTR